MKIKFFRGKSSTAPRQHKTSRQRDGLVSEILADRITRNLWLGILRRKHEGGVHFLEDIKKIGEAVKKHPPKNAAELEKLFRANGCDFIFHKGHLTRELARELLSYARGEADFEYRNPEEPLRMIRDGHAARKR